MAALRAELVVDPSMPGEARYRESMLASFLYKTMLALQPPKSLCASLVSAIQPPLHSRQARWRGLGRPAEVNDSMA